MTFIKELGYDPILGIRISTMMMHLKQNQDPRYRELVYIQRDAWNAADASHPGNILSAGHRAVFNHVESNHPDLYGMIQTCKRELE